MNSPDIVTLCTLKIQDGRRHLSTPEARRLYNARMDRSVRLSDGRRFTFALMSNHVHEVIVSLANPPVVAPDDALERFGRYYDYDEDDPNFRRILPQLRHYVAGGPVPACVKALGPVAHILKRADEWTAIDRRHEIKRRERHNQRGHFWGGPVHKCALMDSVALRRAIAYVDMNPAAAGMEEVPGDKPLTGFHAALAGDPEFRKNYMDLYGVASFDEAATRHSITLAQLGMRPRQGKVMLTADALRSLAEAPCARILSPAKPVSAQREDFAHNDLVSVLSRSGRIWSDDHLQIQVAANPAYDAGKRAHIPAAGLVGSIRTRRRHPDDFNPYEPIDTSTPMPPAPDDGGPSRPTALPLSGKSSKPARKPAASLSQPNASALKAHPSGKKAKPAAAHTPPPPGPTPSPSAGQDDSVSLASTQPAETPAVAQPSQHPWQPPVRPPRFRLVLPPVWRFLATKAHDATPACVKRPPLAPKPAPRTSVPSIPADATLPVAVAFCTAADLRAAYPPVA